MSDLIKAVLLWLAHLFHIHKWEDEGTGNLVPERGALRNGVYYTQKCSVCGKRRMQTLYS